MKELVRKPAWRTLMAEEIDRRRSMPFAWGRNDGGLFAADVVLAMTGEDLARSYRKRYRSEHGAMRMLFEAGIETLPDLIATMLPEIHLSRARTGDVGAVEVNGRWCCGIINGATLIVLREQGVGSLPLTTVKRVFKV